MDSQIFIFYFVIFCYLFRLFLGLHLWPVGVLRLRVQLELQLPAYATAIWDLSCTCNLHHSSWQQWILNLLSEARDWTWVLGDVRFVSCWTPSISNLRNIEITWEAWSKWRSVGPILKGSLSEGVGSKFLFFLRNVPTVFNSVGPHLQVAPVPEGCVIQVSSHIGAPNSMQNWQGGFELCRDWTSHNLGACFKKTNNGITVVAQQKESD